MHDDTTDTLISRAEATPSDAIDSLMPREVITPLTVEQLRDCLAEANQENQAVVLAGNRSKIDWGHAPSRLDLVINTAKMPELIEHAASDLVVRVSASTNFEHLQTELALSNQRLAVDSVVPGSSIGGLIATGISGPLRYGFGSVRDLIIGTTVLRADGVRASTGGRVVKNVAGYDLAKLYTGSYGTLGAIIEAYFRLHPFPEQSHYVLAEMDLAAAEDALGRVLRAPLALSAVEINHNTDEDHVTVGVLIEGREKSVRSRAAMAKDLLRSDAMNTDVRPEWWGRLRGSTTLKVTTEIAAVPTMLRTIRQISLTTGHPLHVTGSAGVGVLFVDGNLANTMERGQASVLVQAIRDASALGGGSTIVLKAPPAIRNSVDIWGPIPALSVMRRLKAEFDPTGILAPGRFVGGI